MRVEWLAIKILFPPLPEKSGQKNTDI